MRTQGRIGAAALAVAAMLALAACEGDADGDVTASPGPSTPMVTTSTPVTSTTTPTPSPSVVVPKAARAHTDAGAIAFAKFYTREVDRAYVTGDTRFLRAYSTKDCNGCDAIYEGVEDLAREGKRQEALAISIKGAERKGVRGKDIVIWITTESREVAYVLRDGTKTDDTTDVGPLTVQVALRTTPTGWLASEFAPVKT